MEKVPLWFWLVLTGLGSVLFLAWYQHANDDTDTTDWTTPKETLQPPFMAPLCITPKYMKARRYPGSLITDPDSIIGEC